MTEAFPDNRLRNDDEPEVKSSEEKGFLHGFKVLVMDIDSNLKLESWKRWRTRVELVDALSITEATALTFGIQPTAISKLSDETTPTEERFIFRMITLLAAAQKGAIKVLAKEPATQVLCEKDLILFSAFIQFLKLDRRTSIPRELIELAWDLYESDKAKRGNLSKLPWKEHAKILADDLLAEYQEKPLPHKNVFEKIWYERCVAVGLKTSRKKTPTFNTTNKEVFRDWIRNRAEW
jgi:hypothetical protein